MAIPKGVWDETGLAQGWFDETALPVGWFDADLLDPPASSSDVVQTLLTQGGSNSINTSITTASVSANAGDLIVITIYSNAETSGNNTAPNTVVMNGTLSFSMAIGAVAEVGWGHVSIWYARATSNITGTIVASFTGNRDNKVWSVSKFTNIASTAQIVQAVPTGPNTSINSITTTLAATGSADNVILAAATAGYATSQNPSFTPEATWTEITDVEQDEAGNSWTIALHTMWRNNTSDLTPTHTYAITAGVGAAVAIEIKKAAAGSNTFSYTASGGLTSGGAAVAKRTFKPSTSGGLISGGAAVLKTTAKPPAGGDMVSGGTATLKRTFAHVASGGLISGGAGAIKRIATYPATGGLNTGGTGAIKRITVAPVSGGLTIGGTASYQLVNGTQTFSYSASGGVTLGGSATEKRSKSYVASGGLISGGAATVKTTAKPPAGGDMVSGGSAVVKTTRAHQATGGLTSGGAASLKAIRKYPASGGLSSGGVASYQYVSSGPTTWAYSASGGLNSGGHAAEWNGNIGVTAGGGAGGGGLPHPNSIWSKLFGAKSELQVIRAYNATGGRRARGSAATAFVSAPVERSFTASGARRLSGSADAVFTPRFDRQAVRAQQNALILGAMIGRRQ